MEVKVIGQMDNTIDHTFESANRIYDRDALCPTLPTCCGGGHIPKIVGQKRRIKTMQETKCVGGLTEEKKSNCGAQYYQQDRVYKGSIALAHPANIPGGSYNYVTEETRYRIRKLTPRECWRLMGYTDGDFEKASAVNSNTQLYKQAGNAIVKQVLMAVFSQLNIQGKPSWNELNKNHE